MKETLLTLLLILVVFPPVMFIIFNILEFMFYLPRNIYYYIQEKLYKEKPQEFDTKISNPIKFTKEEMREIQKRLLEHNNLQD